MSINGAALASSISYVVTAVVTLVVFRRLSGRGWLETIVVRPSDLRAVGRAVRPWSGACPTPAGPVIGLRGGEPAADWSSTSASRVMSREAVGWCAGAADPGHGRMGPSGHGAPDADRAA